MLIKIRRHQRQTLSSWVTRGVDGGVQHRYLVYYWWEYGVAQPFWKAVCSSQAGYVSTTLFVGIQTKEILTEVKKRTYARKFTAALTVVVGR